METVQKFNSKRSQSYQRSDGDTASNSGVKVSILDIDLAASIN